MFEIFNLLFCPKGDFLRILLCLCCFFYASTIYSNDVILKELSSVGLMNVSSQQGLGFSADSAPSNPDIEDRVKVNAPSVNLNTQLQDYLDSVESGARNTNIQDRIYVLKYGVRPHVPQDGIRTLAESNVTPQEDVPAKVIGDALVYPNPFRLEHGAQLGYRLSKSMPIDVSFYDMQANQVLLASFKAGSVGGQVGYNILNVNKDTFYGKELSGGVYFYFIISEGVILAKNKMVIKP